MKKPNLCIKAGHWRKEEEGTVEALLLVARAIVYHAETLKEIAVKKDQICKDCLQLHEDCVCKENKEADKLTK